MFPSLFLAHGSPMLAIEQNAYTDFLAQLGQQYKPDAIVILTAHWENSVQQISYHNDVYETIYDFGGFPPELYQITYPAKGSTAVADIVRQRFDAAAIPYELDRTRGLDHGSWTMLSRMYPDASIPVVQLSVHPFLPAQQQYAIGEALRGLGRERILVIGSGVTVHNLRMLRWEQQQAEPWAIAFDDWMIEQAQSGQHETLFRYMELAPYAKQAVPRAEHAVPFFIALGSGESKPDVLYRDYAYGTLSYLCMSF